MHEKVITLATPVFFLLIGVEFLVGWLRGRNTYRLNDALSSIGLGVLSQIAGVFTRVLRVGIYAWLYQYLALATWPTEGWWPVLLAVIFYDFCYYWHHRWMHRVALAWAAHVVHHSSEDYNLSTALRQTGTGALLGWIPYVPMAIAGVPPSLFAIAALIDLLYQYWIHTEQIGRLGWFDRVFASPSNHRVHHAVNDRYLDRNYGGILILWDRLFGTFEDERADDPPVYGTRHPLRSFNPLWANLSVYTELLRTAGQLPRWQDKLQLWWRPPGWLPAGHRRVADSAAPATTTRRRFDPPLSNPLRAYVALQFLLALGLAVHFLDFQRTASPAALLMYAAWIVITLCGIGAVLEHGSQALTIEQGRHLLGASLSLACLALVPAAQLPVLIPALLLPISLASAAHARWLASSAHTIPSGDFHGP